MGLFIGRTDDSTVPSHAVYTCAAGRKTARSGGRMGPWAVQWIRKHDVILAGMGPIHMVQGAEKPAINNGFASQWFRTKVYHRREGTVKTEARPPCLAAGLLYRKGQKTLGYACS